MSPVLKGQQIPVWFFFFTRFLKVVGCTIWEKDAISSQVAIKCDVLFRIFFTLSDLISPHPPFFKASHPQKS